MGVTKTKKLEVKEKNIEIELFQYNNFVFGRVISLSKTIKELKSSIPFHNTISKNTFPGLCLFYTGVNNGFSLGAPDYLYLLDKPISGQKYNTFMTTCTSIEKATDLVQKIKEAIDFVNSPAFVAGSPEKYPHGAPSQVIKDETRKSNRFVYHLHNT